MRTSGKLLLTGAIVALAVWAAWQYRHPHPVVGLHDKAESLRAPLERRGPRGDLVAEWDHAKRARRVPTAATSFWPEEPAELPKLPPRYQQTFSPIGAILQPGEGSDMRTARLGAVNRPSLEMVGGATAEDAEEPLTHVVKDGDSLPELAARYLGDPRYADALFAANRDVLTAPDLLPLGKELRIPSRRELADGNSRWESDPGEVEPPIVPIPRGALAP